MTNHGECKDKDKADGDEREKYQEPGCFGVLVSAKHIDDDAPEKFGEVENNNGEFVLFPLALHNFGKLVVGKLGYNGSDGEEDVDVKREKLKMNCVIGVFRRSHLSVVASVGLAIGTTVGTAVVMMVIRSAVGTSVRTVRSVRSAIVATIVFKVVAYVAIDVVINIALNAFFEIANMIIRVISIVSIHSI